MGEQAAAPRRLAWEWHATGTTWRIHHDGCIGGELAQRASDAVACDERRWSRFEDSSEVARISAAAGSPVSVSPETLELLTVCLSFQAETHGVFDPLVGSVLGAWGYTAGMQERVPRAATSPPVRPLRGRIELDPERGTARVPQGSTLDLGGIAKGWIADRLASLLRGQHPGGRFLIDAGGDLVAGKGEHLVRVAAEPSSRIALADGSAIATSGWRQRSWRNGDGREAHHLIDPRTGAPGPRTSATVVAASGALADVLAKTLALRPERLSGLRIPARIQSDEGARANAAWDALVEDPATAG